MKEAADKKKTYETPELVTYGDVRILTAAIVGTMTNDNSRSGTLKTS